MHLAHRSEKGSEMTRGERKVSWETTEGKAREGGGTLGGRGIRRSSSGKSGEKTWQQRFRALSCEQVTKERKRNNRESGRKRHRGSGRGKPIDRREWGKGIDREGPKMAKPRNLYLSVRTGVEREIFTEQRNRELEKSKWEWVRENVDRRREVRGAGYSKSANENQSHAENICQNRASFDL